MDCNTSSEFYYSQPFIGLRIMHPFTWFIFIPWWRHLAQASVSLELWMELSVADRLTTWKMTKPRWQVLQVALLFRTTWVSLWFLFPVGLGEDTFWSTVYWHAYLCLSSQVSTAKEGIWLRTLHRHVVQAGIQSVQLNRSSMTKLPTTNRLSLNTWMARKPLSPGGVVGTRAVTL